MAGSPKPGQLKPRSSSGDLSSGMGSRELQAPRRAGGDATSLEQQVHLAAADSDIAGHMTVPH